MNHPVIKILRLIAFFPIVLLVFWALNWIFIKLFIWFVELSPLWFILAFIFLSGICFALFSWLGTLLISVSTFIVPFKWVGPISITLIAIINAIILIIAGWSGSHSFWGIIKAIAFTSVTLEVTILFIIASFTAQAIKDDD